MKHRKRFLAMIMAVMLCFQLLPLAVSASDAVKVDYNWTKDDDLWYNGVDDRGYTQEEYEAIMGIGRDGQEAGGRKYPSQWVLVWNSRYSIPPSAFMPDEVIVWDCYQNLIGDLRPSGGFFAGKQENTEPGSWFDTDTYLQAKAEQLNNLGYGGRNDWTAEAVNRYLNGCKMSTWEHFTLYGSQEGMNMHLAGKGLWAEEAARTLIHTGANTWTVDGKWDGTMYGAGLTRTGLYQDQGWKLQAGKNMKQILLLQTGTAGSQPMTVYLSEVMHDGADLTFENQYGSVTISKDEVAALLSNGVSILEVTIRTDDEGKMCVTIKTFGEDGQQIRCTIGVVVQEPKQSQVGFAGNVGELGSYDLRTGARRVNATLTSGTEAGIDFITQSQSYGDSMTTGQLLQEIASMNIWSYLAEPDQEGQRKLTPLADLVAKIEGDYTADGLEQPVTAERAKAILTMLGVQANTVDAWLKQYSDADSLVPPLDLIQMCFRSGQSLVRQLGLS